MDLGLSNAAVVITGGTKGMGRAASEAFAREGARVAVLARSADALSDAAKARANESERFLVDRGADPDDLYDVMRIMTEDFGHPAHLGRAGDSAEIGPVIAFVASQANTYMTGANVNVDGGSDFT